MDLKKLIYSEKNEEDSEVNTPNIESKSETNEDLDVNNGDDIGDKSFNSCNAKSSEDSFEDDFDGSLGNSSGVD